MAKPFTVIKVFNLAEAPDALRQAHEMTTLRNAPGTAEPQIMRVEVGVLSWPPRSGDDEGQVSSAEHALHRWLQDAGAARGEAVLVTWN